MRDSIGAHCSFGLNYDSFLAKRVLIDMPAIEPAVESATLLVDLKDRSYPIFIDQGSIETVDFCSYITGDKALVVTNETVAPLYLEAVLERLSGKQVDSIVLPDGERYKTLDTLNLIFSKLLERRHDRKTTLIALGGGVVGDMTGFAASYDTGAHCGAGTSIQ